VVFWSFGCEASLLRVHQVQSLVDATGDDVVAIAVHTPRFPYEEPLAAIRSAVTQHQIKIPVVHDTKYLTWNRYNPEGWPATIVVDPRGRVLGTQAGAGDIGVIMNSVTLGLETTAAIHGQRKAMHSAPVSAPLPLPAGDLAFPTSVSVRADGALVIADSGHDRLLIVEPNSAMTGAVAIAEIDGFDQPNSVVCDDADGIFVSERAAGSVSYLDLSNKRRQLLTDDLLAPTGLMIDRDGSLVVSDSGADKLYRIIDGGNDSVVMGLIAGSGHTGSRDGGAGQAELGQPTGLARTEVGIVFCDSASSNIRLLTDSGKVATITGNGFFEWGLVDGPAHKAMLQRPSDLAVLDDGSIIIVDTGNNRLRRLTNRRIRTLGLAGLNRPSGICPLASGHLIIADTGNNRLVVTDPDMQTAWPLDLHGVLPPPGIETSGAGVSSPTA